jgi:hypothetical protein
MDIEGMTVAQIGAYVGKRRNDEYICIVKAAIQDGRVLRIRPDPSGPSGEDYTTFRVTVKVVQ